ncbi:hypothetical protein M8494_35960 [Serratia ureilytica]
MTWHPPTATRQKVTGANGADGLPVWEHRATHLTRARGRCRRARRAICI